MEKIQILTQIAPFNLLDQETLMEIRPSILEKDFVKGSFVFKQGNMSLGTLFIITEGIIEIVVRNDRNIETVVGVRKPFEFFGETGVLSKERYPASVRAVTDCHCLLLNKKGFNYLLEHSHEFANFFSRSLTKRLRAMVKEVIREQSFNAYGLDAEPFKQRICDIMSSPVITCENNDLVTTAASILSKNRISSLVVVNHDQKPVGIITDSDLVARVLGNSGLSLTGLRVRDVMTPDIVALPPDAYFYEALLTMIKNQIRQVPIIDGHTLLGIVTLRDLIQSRSTGALTSVDSIESQQTIAGLKKASQSIDNVLKALIAEKASSQEIGEVMTEFYDRLTRKVLKICEKEMANEGYGPPPVAYTWITMGSSGRKEQIIRTDQDNGLIYEDPIPGDENAAVEYFARFAAKAVEGLYQCGFELCRGDVMATNSQWCKPYKEWLNMVDNWIQEPYSTIRNFTIFLDFRPVYGAKELADKLKTTVIRQIQDHPVVLRFLAKDDLVNKAPLAFFKKFLTENSKEHKGEINLKASALIHIVDCIRIFSIKNGVIVTNTIARLKELTEQGILSKDDAEYLEASYETLLTLRNRENLRKISQGLKPDNYLNPYSLSKREQTVLKESLQAINTLQNLITYHFIA